VGFDYEAPDVTVIDLDKKIRTTRKHHAVKPQLLDIDRLDKRSNAVKEFTSLISRLEADLGGDPSAVTGELIRLYAAASITCRNISAQIALGKPIDIAALAAVGGLLVKVGTRLGLQRRSGEAAPPSLAEYLAAREQEVAS
jgi:hypothetical protein